MIKKIDWVGYFFISIFGIPFLLFNIFPILFGAYISFNEWGIFGEPDWIGLENYTREQILLFIAVHFTFVLSGVLLAYMDSLTVKSKLKNK